MLIQASGKGSESIHSTESGDNTSRLDMTEVTGRIRENFFPNGRRQGAISLSQLRLVREHISTQHTPSFSTYFGSFTNMDLTSTATASANSSLLFFHGQLSSQERCSMPSATATPVVPSRTRAFNIKICHC